ncbi:uncharacterized protein LOC124416238 [Diprion similis]|uniref:uncharacterized protein LOC124416238 n=1 Tax=Diprion similis TaxID=362088 RepID=UPI001EF7F043|nr:uncharacterized protein LOC124416238 [Diprion similis]
MFISLYVTVLVSILLVSTARVTYCTPTRSRDTLSDVFDLNGVEKWSIKLLENIKKSRVLRFNDFVSIETIRNHTKKRTRGDARFLEKLEDVVNTKSLNLDLGLVDLKLFRDAGVFNVDLKLNPRDSSGKKEDGGQMILPLLIGLKTTMIIIGAVSLVGLLTLKAFIVSKTAILIAVILSLKKLFGDHEKVAYEAVYDHHAVVPDHHQYFDHHYEPEIFNGHPEIPDQKLVGIYNQLNDEKQIFQGSMDVPKYEFLAHEADVLKGQDLNGLFDGGLKDYKLESHQKRRSWSDTGKRKPFSLVIGSPHHEPPVLSYKKVARGKNLQS